MMRGRRKVSTSSASGRTAPELRGKRRKACWPPSARSQSCGSRRAPVAERQAGGRGGRGRQTGEAAHTEDCCAFAAASEVTLRPDIVLVTSPMVEAIEPIDAFKPRTKKAAPPFSEKGGRGAVAGGPVFFWIVFFALRSTGNSIWSLYNCEWNLPHMLIIDAKRSGKVRRYGPSSENADKGCGLCRCALWRPLSSADL